MVIPPRMVMKLINGLGKNFSVTFFLFFHVFFQSRAAVNYLHALLCSTVVERGTCSKEREITVSLMSEWKVYLVRPKKSGQAIQSKKDKHAGSVSVINAKREGKMLIFSC